MLTFDDLYVGAVIKFCYEKDGKVLDYPISGPITKLWSEDKMFLVEYGGGEVEFANSRIVQRIEADGDAIRFVIEPSVDFVWNSPVGWYVIISLDDWYKYSRGLAND